VDDVFGYFQYLFTSRAESINFLGWIVARGYSCGDPFVDHFLDVCAIVGWKLMHCRFDNAPFNLGLKIIGPFEFASKICVISWKQIVFMDVV